MHPNVWATNGKQAGKLRDVDLSGLRTCDDNKVWDYDMSSTRFRKRIDDCAKRVKTEQRAALVPDVRVLMEMYDSLEDCRDEGPFHMRWVRWNTMDEHWDMTAMDEVVGGVVYENRPFQLESECVGCTGAQALVCPACSVMGDPQVKNQRVPLVANRADETYVQKYGIPRADWPWALTGKDPKSYELLQQDKGPPDTRPLFFKLTLYMDKFRRGL